MRTTNPRSTVLALASTIPAAVLFVVSSRDVAGGWVLITPTSVLVGASLLLLTAASSGWADKR